MFSLPLMMASPVTLTISPRRAERREDFPLHTFGNDPFSLVLRSIAMIYHVRFAIFSINGKDLQLSSEVS